MNASYRSIWNESLGAWVAASELAKACGKRTSAIAVAASVVFAMALVTAGAARAQVKVGDNPSSIYPGSMLEIESADRGVLFPRVAVADRNTWGLNGNVPIEGTTVFNTSATNGANGLQKGLAIWKGGQWVSVDESPYFHVSSTVTGNSTLANAGAQGLESIAVGPNALATSSSAIAVGNGARAQASAAFPGSSAIAMGAGALATGDRGVTAVAIGGGDSNTHKANGVSYTNANEAYGSGVAIGFGSQAKAGQNTPAGLFAPAGTKVSQDTGGTAVGTYATANGTGGYNTALGYQAHADGPQAIAIYGSQSGYATSIGGFSRANATGATAVGGSSDASAFGAVALGTYAAASGKGAVAIGGTSGTSLVPSGARASGDSAVAIGTDTRATGTSSISIGTGNVVSGNRSGAIGDPSIIDGADSYSIGNNNAIAAGQTDVFVLGNNVGKTLANSVNLGSNAVATAASTAQSAGTTSYSGSTINGTTYAYAGGTPVGVVSVGSVGAERRIQNVAAGQIAAASTDAVNGSQLYGVADKLVNTVSASKVKYFSVASAGGGNEDNLGASAPNAIAVGRDAAATQSGAIAMGPGATAAGSASDCCTSATPGGATAIGASANAQGSTSVALGTNTQTVGAQQVSIGAGAGRGSLDGRFSVAIGSDAGARQNGYQNVAIGDDTAIGDTGNLNVALGSYAHTGGANQAVALGARALASANDSVALGSGSVASQTAAALQSRVPYNPAGPTGTLAGTSPIGEVSIGFAGNERRITNLAAGADETDAVNVSQLRAVATTANSAAQGFNVTSSAMGSGTVSGSSTSNVAPGGTVTYTAGNNIALTQDGARFTIATSLTPTFNTVTVGNTTINNNGLTIAGGPSITNTGVNAGGTTITNVAAGVNPTDAVNVSQLTNVASSAGNKWITGSPGTYVAPASKGTDSTAVGSGANVAANNAVAIGTGASATTANSVALGNNATTAAATAVAGTTVLGTTYTFAGSAPVGVVSVGDAGAERQVTNVAAGRLTAASTDAVNGSQLFATASAINKLSAVAGAGINVTTTMTGNGVAIGTSIANIGPGGTATYTAGNNMVLTQNGSNITIATSSTPTFTNVQVGATSIMNNGLVIQGGPSVTTSGIDAGGSAITNVAPGVAGTDAVNLNQLNQGAAGNRAYTDARVNQLNGRIDDVGRNAYGGVASAIALQMPGTYVPGKTVMRIGYGVFRGESAVGVTFRRTAENNGWSLTGGVGMSRAGAAATVGAEWVFQ